MKNKNKEKDISETKLLESLRDKYALGKQYYGRIHKKMRLLDATDNGDLWNALGAKFPPYQLLPDTNFVSYVKSNILASLYTVAKSAEVVPTSEHDTAICDIINVALEHEWDKNRVGYYQYCAGERAALLNLGLTYVSWDKQKDNIVFRNIDPIHFMRDPFADNLAEAGWCVTYNSYHKSVFLSNPLYKEVFQTKILDKQVSASTEQVPDYNSKNKVTGSKDHYNLFIWWVKNEEGGIDEIHTIDNKVVLFKIENIVPNMFPIAELYCNRPGSNLVGVSEPAKIFANNVVYNMTDSIAYTSEYKNQRPPKFVNVQSQLNLAAFKKHGNEADRTFPVQGDASKAVHYHQFPQVSPHLGNMQMTLAQNIQNITGVDGRYTGRDTGSIITTGGTQEMLNRVTLIDTPKVMEYEAYTARLTEIVLKMLLEYAPKRKYLVKDPKQPSTVTADVKYVTAEVDFPNIDSDTLFEYAIQISSELPKNKQRVQAWANTMMEKQMQYAAEGQQIEIITPEEWLRMQDIPYKEQMLERMGTDRSLNAWIEANSVIDDYASLIEQGYLPEEAMQATAANLEALQQGAPAPVDPLMAPGGPAVTAAPTPPQFGENSPIE